MKSAAIIADKRKQRTAKQCPIAAAAPFPGKICHIGKALQNIIIPCSGTEQIECAQQYHRKKSAAAPQRITPEIFDTSGFSFS
jgi:hypothetical protein